VGVRKLYLALFDRSAPLCHGTNKKQNGTSWRNLSSVCFDFGDHATFATLQTQQSRNLARNATATANLQHNNHAILQHNNHATLQRNNNSTLQRINNTTLQRNNHATLQHNNHATLQRNNHATLQRNNQANL
jgi:hypothetical protein